MVQIINYMYCDKNKASFIAYNEISDRGKIISLVTDGKHIWKTENF